MELKNHITEAVLVIEKTIEYVKQLFSDDYSGHDYYHTMRVYKQAVQIAKQEQADMKHKKLLIKQVI